MKILAHIHTLNDQEVIEESLGAIRAQSRPVDGVLVVDNGSADATLELLPDDVVVIRHDENLGTSGAVHTGLAYARDNGYDWVWVFDADSAPRPDALEKLLEFFDRLPEQEKRRVLSVCCVAHNIVDGDEHHGLLVTDRGYMRAAPASDSEPYACAVTIWTGALYRCDAVGEVGLPSVDYMLDWGELEYGYRGMLAGFRTYIVPASILYHNIRGHLSFQYRAIGFGPLSLRVLEVPPFRCYYFVRNWVYFWLYEYRTESLLTRLSLIARLSVRTVRITLQSLGSRAQLAACFRGLWDGLGKNIGRRY